jgi:hypothetical protein
MSVLYDALELLCPFTEVVRAGFFVLPVRGPSRFLGGDNAVLEAVARCVLENTGFEPHLGIAEGTFCAELAAKSSLVIPQGATVTFRRSRPLSVFGEKDLTTLGQRLGVTTLGAFADLPPARVAERFAKRMGEFHRLARGEVAMLSSQCDAAFLRRMARFRGHDDVESEQLGFFGQRGAQELRADAAVQRVRQRLGSDAVMVATLRGGHSPDDQAALLPWGSPGSEVKDEAPWPGQLRTPAPATTLVLATKLWLRDDSDAEVLLDDRGGFVTPPRTVCFQPLSRRLIVWHAGPWPLRERWWEAKGSRAHIQVVLDGGEALLLRYENGDWLLAGVYD